MAIQFLSSQNIQGSVTISDIANIGSDTDRFLMSDNGVIKYVTGSTLRSYIGAGTSSTNNYVSSVSFNTGNGILTLNRSGLSAITVDIDGRFLPLTGGSITGSISVGNTMSVTNGITVGNGSIILSGTGRIQGIDTVSASTDAASKSYVDNLVGRVPPTPPLTISNSIVGETIEISFNQSSTPDIDYYQVWSSDDGADYGIVAQIAPDGFSSTMTIVDSSFYTGGVMSYRVYAVKQGIYSKAASTTRSYTVGALAVTNMSVTNLNTAYYIQYEKPITRFLDHIEIYMDSERLQSSLSRTGATLIYSGQNYSFMYGVANNNNFHQFWVEVVTS